MRLDRRVPVSVEGRGDVASSGVGPGGEPAEQPGSLDALRAGRVHRVAGQVPQLPGHRGGLGGGHLAERVRNDDERRAGEGTRKSGM